MTLKTVKQQIQSRFHNAPPFMQDQQKIEFTTWGIESSCHEAWRENNTYDSCCSRSTQILKNL